jgi:hypothetical protein
MFLRNKGTPASPNWQLVESVRIHGKQNPKQKIICQLGQFNNFEDLIHCWELLAKDARTARRKNIPINLRDGRNAMLKKYARGLSLKEIKSRLEEVRFISIRYLYHKKLVKTKKDIRQSRAGFNNNAQDKTYGSFVSAVLELKAAFERIKRDDQLKRLRPFVKEEVKEQLKGLFDFLNQP